MLDAGVKFDSERIDLESLEDDQDEELRAALRISHEQFFGKKSALFPTPSCSPPAQYKRKRNRPERIILPDEDTDDDHNSLYSYPYPTPPKKKPATAHQYGSPPHSGNSFGQSGSATSNKNSRYLPEGPINFDQLLRQGQNSAAPTSDEIEGDISESKESVRIAVGPDREIRTLLKNHVWNRPYFREPRSGLNHFTLKDDNIWELNHPELAKLDLADFQFLAEYLAEGEFGLRYPEGPEQTKEVIAQCVSTWEMGDKLGMYDLLEHIVEKVQYFEWDNTDVLIFAVIVYRTPDQPTPAHESMRDWLSGYLAQHFWTYIRDDTIGPLFRQRLKAIPDLERQVFEKRTAMLVSGAELDEDGESDGDGL
ncbi:hypothetical protein DE146DRAFT_612058 [Phaeosphaeria sp. MPI-PUGE-AT-0046c]|nr:hypothetical protein DE146DRAFT_612058 [Phaeosphaeria sp. MPI-PUGE-AT-0046c]